MKNYQVISKLFVFLLGCSSPLQDTFTSKHLMSSKGEDIYVNSLNWGITDDHQVSIISKDQDRVKNRDDTVGAAKGLEPFYYSFRNDTLRLFFLNEINYRVNDTFKSIIIEYTSLDNKKFAEVRNRSLNGKEFYSVPSYNQAIYPSEIPKAPTKNNK